MKRYGNLFEKIINMNNLRLAHKNASKGKSKYKDVKMVNSNIDYYLEKIQKMLINNTYSVSPYKVMKLNDGNKIRTIHKLSYYPDRIIQWAILLILNEIFMSCFVEDTYASLPERGIHKIVKSLKNLLYNNEENLYCLKFDVRKFYENIDHNILKNLLRKKIKDQKVLRLFDLIIDSIEDGKGIPIGNYTSQYFANFYLSYFDHWVKEALQIKNYYRYMDDIVLISNDSEKLHNNFKLIETYLRENLLLEIKKNWQVFLIENRGIDFVGYRFFMKYTLLRKSITMRFKKTMLKGKNPKSVPSYLGWIKWCNAYNLSNKYLGVNNVSV